MYVGSFFLSLIASMHSQLMEILIILWVKKKLLASQSNFKWKKNQYFLENLNSFEKLE